MHFQQHKHRDLDTKHVEYLKGCFRKDRCRRLEVRNHIEAEVDQQILDIALRDSNVTARELLTNQPNGYPRLVFPQGFQLECLHGQHRIQAAREFLPPTDKWWTVDLYTSGEHGYSLPRMKLTFVRYQRGPENMSQRAAFQRGPTKRWRGILQDTVLPLSTRHERRVAMEGLPAGL
ncbi:hypothetical protein DL95DRAFT_73744 [Leptodontidium sp. 2 PMI_412]|nr:hypothetical protein DL95DRAFT_73744 [Leptodontidium sp. 2 PMI_412]